MECNQCGSTENVKRFMHFNNNQWEKLCWECRYPIIQERLETEDDGEEEPKTGGQTGLGDFL